MTSHINLNNVLRVCFIFTLLALGSSWLFFSQNSYSEANDMAADKSMMKEDGMDNMMHDKMRSTAMATFAGGCFWCMEKPFDTTAGVVNTIVGYTGGTAVNPTYKQVSSGITGHTEAVQIEYDPAVISYEKLLDIFWRQIDPTDSGGQFVDRGQQYRSEIFYHDETQKKLAMASKDKLTQSGIFSKPLVTAITPAGTFYAAEEYHQDYYKNNPLRYKFYRHRSGRDQYLEKIWTMDNKMSDQHSKYQRPDDKTIKSMLSEKQYYVTQQEGTEAPFKNAYWNNKQAGLYVDIVSGEPLFSSLDKYDSGTGWPSFTKPVDKQFIITKKDNSFFVKRTEVRSRYAGSHLGHVFMDGPLPTKMRFCINSAALKFIPAEDMAAKGYDEYLHLFADINKPMTTSTKKINNNMSPAI